jgi:hypothetical protein
VIERASTEFSSVIMLQKISRNQWLLFSTQFGVSNVSLKTFTKRPDPDGAAHAYPLPAREARPKVSL